MPTVAMGWGAESEAANATRVVIVEDHEMVARSLAVALRAHDLAVEIVSVAPTSERAALAAALVRVASAPPPPVVLLDLDLAAGIDGTDLVQPLARTGAHTVVLSGASDRLRLARCVERGAVALVSKAEPLDQLVGTIRRVAAGRPGLAPGDRERLLAELRAHRAEQRARLEPFRQLTRREAEVLGALTQGRAAEEIAEAWSVSIGTVRSQIHALLAKLGVHSQQAAMALAWQVGWVAAAGRSRREEVADGIDGRPKAARDPEIHSPVDDGDHEGPDPVRCSRGASSASEAKASRSDHVGWREPSWSPTGRSR